MARGKYCDKINVKNVYVTARLDIQPPVADLVR